MSLPTNTVWHVIHEEWLSKWRRFVLGRDARRYAPPGPISNKDLYDDEAYDETKVKTVKMNLVKARDYRLVNYNVLYIYIYDINNSKL